MKPAPDYLQQLFNELRRRGFVLSPDDYMALQVALREGFGWGSNTALRDLCVALWARSLREKEMLEKLFNEIVTKERLSEWTIEVKEAAATPDPAGKPVPETGETPEVQKEMVSSTQEIETTEMSGEQLPDITFPRALLSARPLTLVPQLPLTYREVAQAWRRLRRTVHTGRPVELDIDATISRYSRTGLSTEVVLVPRRRNVANLLILLDRKGAMTPFHRFCDEVCSAILHSAQLNQVDLYYFSKVPSIDAERLLLDLVESNLNATLDRILNDIAPARKGYVYSDAGLKNAIPLGNMLALLKPDTDVVIISDADAARGSYDLERLLNTLAFLKRLREYTVNRVWLNPLPHDRWTRTTAAQLARHVAMLPMDKQGMYQAVNLLRGQPYPVEKPV